MGHGATTCAVHDDVRRRIRGHGVQTVDGDVRIQPLDEAVVAAFLRRPLTVAETPNCMVLRGQLATHVATNKSGGTKH